MAIMPLPNRNVNYSLNNYPERWEKFVNYTHKQVMELMTGYGRVDILWLDGGWSWTPGAEYMSGRRAIHMLVDIVAKGGNLLLNIAPGPDGSWDRGAYRLLEDIGTWMDINSEAIYGTRAIAPYKEGKICYTSGKDGTLYAIYLLDEGEKVPEEININGISIARGSEIRMTGEGEKLKWTMTDKGCRIFIPAEKADAKYAFSLKIDPKKH